MDAQHNSSPAWARWFTGFLLGLPLACGHPTSDAPDDVQQAARDPARANDAVATPTSGPPEPQLPDAVQLLERGVDAVGGREALDGLRSLHYTGKVAITGQAIEGTMELWWADGDYLMVQEVPGMGIIREGKSGERLWTQDPIMGLRELTGAEATQHRWLASVAPVAVWKEFFDSATSKAERVEQGRRVVDVELRGSAGLTTTLTLDAESGLLLGQSLEALSPMGKSPVSSKWEDYREVGGLQFSFRQPVDMGIAQVVQTIDTAEAGVPVDRSRFDMPTGDREVVSGKPMPSGASTPPKAMMPFGEDGKPGKPVPTSPSAD